MKNILQGLVITFVLVFSIIPNTAKAEADLLYGQNLYTASETAENVFPNAYTGYTQRLGTGLTGQVQTVVFRASFEKNNVDGGTDYYGAFIAHCDDSGYTVNCTNDNFNQDISSDWITITGATTTLAQYAFSTSTAYIQLLPTKYYYITFAHRAGSDTTRIKPAGTTSNSYTGGVCLKNSATSLSSLVDCYFGLLGVQTVNNFSTITNISPANGSTTATTNVNFRLQYNNNVGAGYFCINIFNLTVADNYRLCGVAYNGFNSFSQNITLQSGHLYNWTSSLRPAIDGSSEDRSVVTGNLLSFSVVTDFNANYGGSASSSPFYIPPQTEGEASSTLDARLNLGFNIWRVLLRKFPLNWGAGIINDLNSLEVDPTAELYFEPVEVDFGALGFSFWSDTNGALYNLNNTNNFKFRFFSTSTIAYVASLPVIQGARTLAVAISWGSFIFFVLRLIWGMFKKSDKMD